jgi:putative tryptophan/tyrosine transport system substrate-binding protein
MTVTIGRRELLAALGGAAAWPLAARAQEPGVPVVGFLSSLSQSVHFANAFRRGLADMGYVEGQNVAIEYRWMEDSYDAVPGMAADLVQRHVAVIGAFGPPAVLAAKAAATSTPIVFITGADPIKFGFVSSFNHPGGNLTGIWLVTSVLAEKRLELIREIVPNAALIGLLVNPNNPATEQQTRDAQAAASALGLKLSVLHAITASGFDQAFALLVQQRADALMVGADPLFASRQEELVALAARHHVPTIYEWREFVEAGGLMSYGTVIGDGLYRGGLYAGRILKGAKPADLPVEQLNKLELVINLKTAKSLGLTVPLTLQASADEVIE